MALAVHISSYVSGGYTNPVRWDLIETGTGVKVDEHFEPGPHGVIYNFSWVNNIKDIVYTIKMYDVPGGTGLGNLIKSHDVTVSTSTLTLDADIETIVDGGQPEDPVGNEKTSPPIPEIAGKDFYVVQRGVGQRRRDRVPEIIINADGSYTFTDEEETFNPEDTFIIKIRAQYVVNPPGSQSGSSTYKDILLITADTLLTSLDWGKLLIVDGMAPVITITFPTIASMPEKISLWIESVGTTHINAVLKAATGETIAATGEISNTFILSRACKAEVLKLGSTLYGFTDDNDIKCRGQIEWGYSIGLNRLPAFGDEYLVADYPGLKKAMDAMQTGTVVTYSMWDSSQTITYVTMDTQAGPDQVIETKLVYPYKGFFALSLDGLHFRVPDLRNKFIRGLNGNTSDSERITQGAGGYQVDQFKKHFHVMDNSNNTSGAGKAGTGNQTTEGQFLQVLGTGGSETRGENNALIPLIIL